jgi:flagellar biosynthetic protein FlhB
VATSAELYTGVLLLAGVAALLLLSPVMADVLRQGLRADLLHSRNIELGQEEVAYLFLTQLGRGLNVLGVLLGVLFVLGVAAGVLQVGFAPSAEILALKWERLSPARGWGRILSKAGLMRGLFSTVKVAVIAGLAWWVLQDKTGQIAGLMDESLHSAVAAGWGMAVRMALVIAGALTVVGVADYAWQRWQHEQSLHMTKQEKKDEQKEDEGDPQVKLRQRKLQREAAQQRMYREVPKASVVITNPTHLAIALRYEQGAMSAPRVVAKGAGHVAQRLIELARRHGVPIVERKPLAHALYRAVKLNQEIPAVLYQAVAEVLAYIYRLRVGGV